MLAKKNHKANNIFNSIAWLLTKEGNRKYDSLATRERVVRYLVRGSGCGSVGRVASKTRNPRFKSQQRQNVIFQLYT